MLTTEAFAKWLDAYGHAWQTRDPAAATGIFSAGAHYHWTPLDPPMEGHAGIAAAWEHATSTQRDIRFTWEIWSVSGMRGVAHWHVHFTRTTTGLPVDIDGVLLAEFDVAGTCRLFREWWHSSEGS